MMLDFEDGASKREKCLVKVVQLPAFVDPKRIPSKKAPFSTILHHPFVHTVEVILPKEVYNAIQPVFDTKLDQPRCARVFMSPSQILDHEFFNQYIKIGDVLMISEKATVSDTVYTLREGILRIELGRETYEQTGLVGKPIQSGGRKHVKERFLIELNLRLPSMLHGKQGFERIVWAFKNVLNQSMAWLFCDLGSASTKDNDHKAIEKQHPQWMDCTPCQTDHSQIRVPPLSGLAAANIPETELQENCQDLSEWVGLVQIGSPRVAANDDVDPYLCRYQVPNPEQSSTVDLVSLKWRGLISPSWTVQLLLLLLSRSQTAKSSSSQSWFVLSAATLDKQAVDGRDGFTVLAAPNLRTASQNGAEERNLGLGQHTICWEFMGANANGSEAI